MRARRSIVFYAWLGLVGQTVFLMGAVVFVVAGASYQRTAIRANSRAQRLQLETVTIQASFLNALRSVRFVCPVLGTQAAMRHVDPALAAEQYIFPAADLLARGHYFKLLPPPLGSSYNSRFATVLGL